MTTKKMLCNGPNIEDCIGCPHEELHKKNSGCALQCELNGNIYTCQRPKGVKHE